MYNVVNITTTIPAEMLKELMALSENERMPVDRLVQYAISELLYKFNPEKALTDKIEAHRASMNFEKMNTDISFIKPPK